MAAMAFLGFAGHSGSQGGHDTAGHDVHGIGGASHGHAIDAGHVGHPGHVGHADHAGHAHAGAIPHHAAGDSRGLAAHDVHLPHVHGDGWKSHLWSWLSPRALFNFLVGFGATGMIVERLIGPVLALPVAVIGGVAFEAFIVRPIFNSLFRFESQPAQTLESAIMSEARAVTVAIEQSGDGAVAELEAPGTAMALHTSWGR